VFHGTIGNTSGAVEGQWVDVPMGQAASSPAGRSP
jgi:hypothetical protein